MARIRVSADRNPAGTDTSTWYIALYIRLSREDGLDESLSITNQKKILDDYLRRFFQNQYVLVDYYTDDGRTGTDYQRPEFQRMIQDIELQKVNCVICKNLSRAFRNYADQGYFLESFFPLHKTRFITLSDPSIDTYLNPDSVNGMEIPISGLMNDRYAYAISNSVRRTFDTKRRNGEFIGAFAPYGYAKHPHNRNTLIIDEEAARVVSDIFHWFVYGDGSDGSTLSKRAIAGKLNDAGIPNPTLYKAQNGDNYKNPHARSNDGLWTASSVSRILQNKVYIGTLVQGRQRVISYKIHQTINTARDEWFEVPQTHEPIITEAVFLRARKLQLRDTRTPPHQKKSHLFSGLLTCADCQKAMTRRTAKGIVYYNCSTYKRKSAALCTKHTIRLDVLETTVLNTIQLLIKTAGISAAVIDHIHKTPVNDTRLIRYRQDLDRNLKLFKQNDHVVFDLYSDWKQGIISRNQFEQISDISAQKTAQLTKRIQYLQNQITALENTAPDYGPDFDYFHKNGTIPALTQSLLTELIDTIYVHEDNKITISFRFSKPEELLNDANNTDSVPGS